MAEIHGRNMWAETTNTNIVQQVGVKNYSSEIAFLLKSFLMYFRERESMSEIVCAYVRVRARLRTLFSNAINGLHYVSSVIN